MQPIRFKGFFLWLQLGSILTIAVALLSWPFETVFRLFLLGLVVAFPYALAMLKLRSNPNFQILPLMIGLMPGIMFAKDLGNHESSLKPLVYWAAVFACGIPLLILLNRMFPPAQGGEERRESNDEFLAERK